MREKVASVIIIVDLILCGIAVIIPIFACLITWNLKYLWFIGVDFLALDIVLLVQYIIVCTVDHVKQKRNKDKDDNRFI